MWKYYAWLWLTALPILLFLPFYMVVAFSEPFLNFADWLIQKCWNIARKYMRKD